MAGAARKKADESWQPSRPATSREARQAQLENLALDLIEQRLREGTASSQETTMFAKSASTRGKIEEIRLEAEVELMRAKKTNIESQEEMQRMFTEAITAMGTYQVERAEGGDEDVHRSY